MLKITIFFTLVIIASVTFASSMSCQSCGTECVTACGTRRFRTCCFNYLRRKRGPEAVKFSAHHLQGSGPDREIQQRVPGFLLEDLDFWGVPNTPSYVEDTIENGLQTYDA